MTVRRLLAVAVGGATFTAAAPVPIQVTPSPDGGWTQITGPHAVWHLGRTYVAFVDSSGNLELAVYPDGGPLAATRTISAAFQDDAHAAPSILVRSDGKLLIVYSAHNSANMFYKVSTDTLVDDPDLANGFTSATNIDSQLGGISYTYPSLGWYNGDIYLTYRDRNGGTDRIAMSHSTDDGATWAAETLVISEGVTSYAMVHFGDTRIDFATSNGNGVGDSNVDIFHFYYDGTFHKTDGTTILSPPFTASELQLVYNTGTGTGWPGGMAIDGTGAPIIVSEVLNAALGTDLDILYHRWDGSAWDVTSIASADLTGLQIVAHSALDEDDARIVWTAEPVSGVFEIFRYRTFDSGVTFQRQQVTSGSSSTGNIYPVNIRDRGQLLALWLTGTYHDTVEGDFTLGITGAR